MKLLSKEGKDVLLCTVAQAMPNYLMSLFLLPLDTCKDLETLMNGFFWYNGGMIILALDGFDGSI